MFSRSLRATGGLFRLVFLAGRPRAMGIGCALLGATVALLVILGFSYYARWRVGRIELTTEGEPLVAQVLAEESDGTIGDAATTRAGAGRYRGWTG